MVYFSFLYCFVFLSFWIRFNAVIFLSLMASRTKDQRNVFQRFSIYVLISRWYSISKWTSPKRSSFSFKWKNLSVNCCFVVSLLRNILKRFFVIFSRRLIHFWRLYLSRCFSVKWFRGSAFKRLWVRLKYLYITENFSIHNIWRRFPLFDLKKIFVLLIMHDFMLQFLREIE